MREIPFEASLANAKHVSVETKSGLPVRILCTDAELDNGESIVAIVDNEVATYFPDGHYYEDETDEYDLVMKVDDEGFEKESGFNPMEAAMMASLFFGDPSQYSQEELDMITDFVALCCQKR
jgi:hypothetical protein